MRAAPVALLAALLAAGCFPPRPASERPLSYRAPVPGWVRHDVDSTLSLLLPPELERQPRADTAFAPVVFVSDSTLVTVQFAWHGDELFPAPSQLINGTDRGEIRNGNPGRFAWLRPSHTTFEHGQAGYYFVSSSHRIQGFFRIGEPLPGAERFEYPKVLVVAEARDSTVVDHVFDYVRLAHSP